MISLTLISLRHDDLVRLAAPHAASWGGATLSRGLSLAAAALAFTAAVAMAVGHF